MVPETAFLFVLESDLNFYLSMTLIAKTLGNKMQFFLNNNQICELGQNAWNGITCSTKTLEDVFCA